MGSPEVECDELLQFLLGLLEDTDTEVCARILAPHCHKILGNLAAELQKGSVSNPDEVLQVMLVIGNTIPGALQGVAKDGRFCVTLQGYFWRDPETELGLLCIYVLSELSNQHEADLSVMLLDGSIEALFDLLGRDNEDLCAAVAMLLIHLHRLYPTPDASCILRHAAKHKNGKFFGESVLRLVNRNRGWALASPPTKMTTQTKGAQSGG